MMEIVLKPVQQEHIILLQVNHVFYVILETVYLALKQHAIDVLQTILYSMVLAFMDAQVVLSN